MAAPVQTKVTPEAYLELERKAMHKSEYRHGEIVAMSGASLAHNIIVSNVMFALRKCLQNSGCLVLPSDMKVYAPECESYFYPDVTVVYGKIEFHEEHKDYFLNPSVTIEVLSSTTEAYDRGEKFKCYRTIPALQEYVLVSPGQVLVERYSKESPNHWDLVFAGDKDESITIGTCQVRLADVYENVDFTFA
jgi:Uma2 family endonuclease